MAKDKRRPIRVALVGAEPLRRSGLEASLASQDNVQIVSIPPDAEGAVEAEGFSLPEVLIADHESSPHAVQRIRDRYPRAKVIVLSSADWHEEARQAALGEIQGYLSRSASVEDVIRAVETVHSGGIYFSARALRAAVKARAKKGEPLLTRRERQVLELVAEGSTSREIATSLRLSVRTVETHRYNIMHKLGIHTVAGLTRFAIENGIIRPE